MRGDPELVFSDVVRRHFKIAEDFHTSEFRGQPLEEDLEQFDSLVELHAQVSDVLTALTAFSVDHYRDGELHLSGCWRARLESLYRIQHGATITAGAFSDIIGRLMGTDEDEEVEDADPEIEAIAESLPDPQGDPAIQRVADAIGHDEDGEGDEADPAIDVSAISLDPITEEMKEESVLQVFEEIKESLVESRGLPWKERLEKAGFRFAGNGSGDTLRTVLLARVMDA